MLKRLRIRNFALIDELEVEFGKGLNVLTGTTGAGKSIIVGAVELATGKRGSDDLIRTGKSSAIVEAEFTIDNSNLALSGELEDYVEGRRSIIFRREYKRGGGGGGHIGTKRVNLSILKSLSDHILSIMGQHSHQRLLDPSTHIEYLDNFANMSEDLEELGRVYRETSDLRQKLSHALRNRMELNDKIDLLKFQINEIETANLKADEEETLKSEKKLLENARAIMESGEAAISMLLESEDSAVAKTGEAEKILRASAAGQNVLEDVLGIISSASDSISQAVMKIRSFIDGVEDNPERLEEINARIHEIFRLKKKYNGNVPDILDYLEKSKRELGYIRGGSEDPKAIQAKLDKLQLKLNKLALRLSKARKTAKIRLEKSVMENLSQMGMQKAQFSIDIALKKDDEGIYCVGGHNVHGDATGFDMVEFLFCANPGEGLKQLARIASGGEISRVMLALKNALMDRSGAGCEIFDEIDVGISGEAASKVAEQLKLLSENRQVICITHLHQIASVADHHFKVSKQKLESRSVTVIEEVKSEDRVREIASLLSGKTITKKALEGAREILKNSKR